MSVNIILLPLSSWATSHLTSVLESNTQDKFNTAFDATFATNCTFTSNGKVVSRDEYKSQLLGQSAAGFGEASTVVKIEDQTQIETDDQGQLSGVVGIFYTATSDSRFLVLGAPSESKASSSINLTIEPTEKDPQNPNLHVRGFYDPRRVTSVNQVVAETTCHVTIPQASVPKTTTSQQSPTKVELGPGPLHIPSGFLGRYSGLFGYGAVSPSETGGTLPGGPGPVKPTRGIFHDHPVIPTGGGVGPVIIPGESLGQTKD